MGTLLVIKGANFSENAVPVQLTAPAIVNNNGTISLYAEGAASIYYTVDGTTPTSSSNQYSVPFAVQLGTTVKAIAYDINGNASDVTSYKYVIHTFVEFVRKRLTSSQAYRAVYNATIPVGCSVGFANPAMYELFKYAISISGTWPETTNTWDTSYTGEPYIDENVEITTQAVQIMVALVDGSSMTEEQLAILNNDTFFVDAG